MRGLQKNDMNMSLAEVAVFVFPLFGCIEIDVDIRAVVGLCLGSH